MGWRRRAILRLRGGGGGGGGKFIQEEEEEEEHLARERYTLSDRHATVFSNRYATDRGSGRDVGWCTRMATESAIQSTGLAQHDRTRVSLIETDTPGASMACARDSLFKGESH